LSVGVDLFLVVSGYVITLSLIKSIAGQGNPSIKSAILSFWIRRIYRILPNAWFWLGIVVMYKVIALTVDDRWDASMPDFLAIAAALANVMNFYSGYCATHTTAQICAGGFTIHGHYWSLSLEEQFYMVFPFLFFWLNRRQLTIVVILIIAAQFFWKRPFFTISYNIKTDALAWGVLLALLSSTSTYNRIKSFCSRHRGPARFSAILFVISMPVIGSQILGVHEMKSYGIATIALLGAVVVFLASFDLKLLSGESKLGLTLKYLGSRSYSIYIVHLILFAAIRDTQRWYDPGLELLWQKYLFDSFLYLSGVAATLLLSEWTYRRIEVPWRRKGVSIASRQT
jgi:peptidoglycan/LPS O-acetylase OafA/YrhL